MASNRSNFLGLHLQNDQTGTPGTYQRDDNVPLHLSSAGIKHETNWNNAINSLGGGDAPWFANDSIDGYPTDIKIVDDIALVSYGDYSETFSAELSLTSLKYGTAGFSSTFYDASTIGFRKADNPLPELGDKDEAFTGLWMDMPEDLTEAMEAEKVFDSTLVSRQIQQGNIELVGGKYPMHPKAMDLSGATVEIELDGNITSNNASQYYSELDGYKVTLSYGGAAEYQSIKVWDSGAEKYVTSACTEKSKAIGVRPGTNSPVVDGFNLKVEMYAERDYDINEYVHWDNGMDGKVFFGVNMSYV